MAHSHLKRVEPAPGDANPPNISVRPGLMSQPGYDLLAVGLLLLRIFALGRNTFACAEAADINASAHVAAAGKVSMLRIITRSSAIVLAIGKILEQCGEFLV